MRYLIGGDMGWFAVPFIFLVGAAYVWVADRLVGEKAEVARPAEFESVRKAA